MRWWTLDDRFVRSTSSVDSGYFDILGCQNGICNVEWYRGGSSQPEEQTLNVWSEPTAVAVYVENYFANEWLRVAD